MSNKQENVMKKTDGKRRLIPSLRFPEFREKEGWEEMAIGHISETVTAGGTPSTSVKGYWGGNIRWMNSGELNHKRVYEVQGRITDDGVRYSSTKVIPKESVLIGLAGQGKTRGTVAMNMIELCINQSIAAVFPNEKIFYSDYLYHNLDNRYDELRSLSAGGEGRGGLNLQIIRSMQVPLPVLSEQIKVADCLSSADELITLEAQKLNALKAHKNGLMQQLFPAEGETLPKLRFPEFQDEDEWKETTIGKIGSFYYGKSAPKWSLEEDAPTRCVRYGELYTKFDAVITETYSRTNIDPSNLRFSKGGEILVPRVGEKPEDFGKCCCYLPLKDIAIGEMISVFETKQNPLFYTYYFRSLYRQFAKVVEGQNVKNLYYAVLEPLSICRPSLPEQKKIADLLASLDAIIAAQSRKVDALKIHKKGLMQQLFPITDEVDA